MKNNSYNNMKEYKKKSHELHDLYFNPIKKAKPDKKGAASGHKVAPFDIKIFSGRHRTLHVKSSS